MIGTRIKLREYNVYKVLIRNEDHKGLVIGRMEVAAENRAHAQEAGEWWCKDRGLEPNWNCHVSVMRKVDSNSAGGWATTLVAR